MWPCFWVLSGDAYEKRKKFLLKFMQSMCNLSSSEQGKVFLVNLDYELCCGSSGGEKF
jgi:hypothetical protein